MCHKSKLTPLGVREMCESVRHYGPLGVPADCYCGCQQYLPLLPEYYGLYYFVPYSSIKRLFFCKDSYIFRLRSVFVPYFLIKKEFLSNMIHPIGNQDTMKGLYATCSSWHIAHSTFNIQHSTFNNLLLFQQLFTENSCRFENKVVTLQ